MFDRELVCAILGQIQEASARIARRFTPIASPDDFHATDAGLDRLDAICMMLIAIGESLKHLDKITDGVLLSQYPEIDWVGAKGMRDVLSHHYFDINSEIVFDVCATKLPKLRTTLLAIERDHCHH